VHGAESVESQKRKGKSGVISFFRSIARGKLPQMGMIIAFVVLVFVFSILSNVFLTFDNFINIANQTATVSVVAFGMTIVMLAGGIDLSVGSVVSISAVVSALLLNRGSPVLLAMLVSLLIGLCFGFFNGFISVNWAIQPFLVTLGSMSVARGLSLILSGGRTIYINSKTFLFITGRGHVGPVSVLFIWTLFFFIVTLILMTLTTFGRRVRAVGGNLVAARQAGLRVKTIQISTFVLSGGLAAFSGLMLAGRLSSGLPSVGVGMELDAIAASVLGGTGFKGEGGSMVGTLFGALVLGTVINGLTILGVNPYIQEVAKGMIIVLAVLIANIRKSRKA
jgi:ribose/xylose/arabinose/galactoside ABC-type transport system permease subunit